MTGLEDPQPTPAVREALLDQVVAATTVPCHVSEIVSHKTLTDLQESDQ
jgi:hypothetical protein